MTTSLLPPAAIALVGAPDSDVGPKHAAPAPVQAMQVDMAQDLVDELLESVRTGKAPQIIFGRTPQLRCGHQTHVLKTSSEAHRCELYKARGAGDEGHVDFAGLIHHRLVVQRAQHVTAGVDSALEQLRSSMAAISEFKEANKTIVGEAAPGCTPGHGRFPSTGFKASASHLAPARLGSPLLSAPSSPMHRRPPTSQPGSPRELVLAALRVPVLHLLARGPSTEVSLAAACRTSVASMRHLLPKLAKKASPDADKWQLTDKSFRELNPWKFPYQSAEHRQQAIDGAIRSFDRQRLAKDDKLWQILLPREERGQGTCLSRSTVKAPEAKPATPMHMPKISDLTKKKPAPKKVADRAAEKEKKPKLVKDAEPKPKSAIKEKYLAREKPTVKVKERKEAKDEPTKPATPSNSQTAATSHHNTPSTDASKIRTKKVPATDGNNAPRVKPKTSARDVHREPPKRHFKSTMPINTKPKNPSPLSASPPVNASDFEDSHPVHKALAAAPSPAKNASGNSDRSLKRKANDLDSDIHNHNLAVKKPHMERSTPNHTPSHANGRVHGSKPSSTSSRKRKTDESSSSNTPTTAPKVRKVTNIDTGLASRYHHNNPRASPGASSSSTTSPSMPSLSFRQTVELSRRFQTYYKKYEELYWKLADATTPPTDVQRNGLLDMHKKLEEMKREIKAGAVTHR